MNDLDECDLSYEPMDVDISNNSIDVSSYEHCTKSNVTIKKEIVTEEEDNNLVPTDISNEYKPKVAQAVKKYHIKIYRENKKTYGLIKIISAVLLVLISIMTYYVTNFKCSNELDVKELKKTLTRNVYGQPKAIELIVETLTINTTSNIMIFYGGTGVGKTLTASLILDGLWNSSNIYHYTMPGFIDTFSTDFMIGLTMCKSSMLVVDDLTIGDLNIKSLVGDFIEKSDNLKKNVTVILIFNCDSTTKEFKKKCDESFYEELKEGFGDINTLKRFVKFDPLMEEHLIMCIEKELGKKVVNRLDMENILKNFNVSLDGCKGVSMKMKYLNVVRR